MWLKEEFNDKFISYLNKNYVNLKDDVKIELASLFKNIE